MKCMRVKCKAEAKWRVGFRAWARGFPRTTVPLQGFTNMVVCDNCRHQVKASDLFQPESIARTNTQLLQKGFAPADLANAELSFRELLGEKPYLPKGDDL